LRGDDQAWQTAQERSRSATCSGNPLAGPSEWWAETLTGFVRDGFDTLIFWPVDPSPDQVTLFAEELVPLLSDQGDQPHD
jgi:hypothetical protein